MKPLTPRPSRNAQHAKYAAHQSLVKEWVKTSGLVAPALESQVTHPTCMGVGIVSVNRDDGTSTVYFAEMGHVREGVGSHGRILPWEELEPTNSTYDWPLVPEWKLRQLLTDLDPGIAEDAQEEMNRRVRAAGGSPVITNPEPIEE